MASALAFGQAVGRIFEEAETTSALALAPIADALDGSYALLFRTSAQGAIVEHASCHGVDFAYLDRLREASRERFLPGWLSGLAPGSVFDRAAFGDDHQFARTTFFNHVIRPEGRFHCMIATPWVTSRHRFHLVVGRPRRRAEFGEGDRRLLHLMLPQVTSILRLEADLATATGVARQAQDGLDLWPAPFLIVDGDAVPRFANAAARHWLARGDVVRLDRRGCLTLASAAQTDRLRRALAAVARNGAEQSLVSDAGGGHMPVCVSLKRMTDGLSDEGCRVDIGVLIHADESETLGASDHRVALVARQHGLTPREAALLHRLVAGDTLKRAARHLDVSYNTCRSYLRQIFDKLAIHRQSDLVRFCTTGLRPGQRMA